MSNSFMGFILQIIGVLFLCVFLAECLDSYIVKHDIIQRAIRNNIGNYYVVNDRTTFKFNVEMGETVK